MADLERKINVWLRDQLIPRLADVMGESCGTVKPEFHLDRPHGSFFLSDLFFANVRFTSDGPEHKILIKLPAQNPETKKLQNYMQLFANEMLAYECLLAGSTDYPQCYLCGEDPEFQKIIVLENVCPRGYSVCPDKINLSFEYLKAGLRSIGRFHGDMYALKEREFEKFQKIVDRIEKVRYAGDNKIYKENVNKRCSRITRAIRNRTKNEDFVSRIERLFENCYHNVLMRCVEPREPLAIIVHGDCTPNNVLFRRAQGPKAGQDVEAMLVDFALIMYSSPSIDVSTFLYMSAPRWVIKERFKELFKTYHDSVAHRLRKHGIWDATKYSYDAFLRDYKRSAIFGYVIAAFFLPIMNEYAKNNDILQQLDDDLIEHLNLTGGGEALSNDIADMLIDMHDAGMLGDFV